MIDRRRDDPMRWRHEDVPEGLDSVPHDKAKMARFRLLLGPIYNLLQDPTTNAVRVNADGAIIVLQFRKPKRILEERMAVEQRQALIGWLANLEYGRAMDRLHSRLQCDLPVFGSRCQFFAPPISNWTMVFRNHHPGVIPFSEYEAVIAATPPPAVRDRTWYGVPDRVMHGWGLAIREAIRLRKNIGTAGNVGSGKTTILNSLLGVHAEIYSLDRLVIVQDRREVTAPGFFDQIELIARVEQEHPGLNGSVSRYTYEFSDAVEDSMRCDGDAFAWGEVRDERSAVGIALAANTGAIGIKYTTHASAAEDIPLRFEDLFRVAGYTPIRRQIAELCQLLVYMQDDPDVGPRIIDVIRILGVKDGEYVFERVSPLPEDFGEKIVA